MRPSLMASITSAVLAMGVGGEAFAQYPGQYQQPAPYGAPPPYGADETHPRTGMRSSERPLKT